MADEPTEPGAATEPEPTEPASGKGGDTPDLAAEVEKWKSLARKHESQAKANAEAAKKLAELEDKDKSELQRLTDAKTTAEREAADAKLTALRLEVALDRAPEGMPVSRIRKLASRLHGSTREELEADAAELFEEFGAPTKPPAGKPTERLKGGTEPGDEPPPDGAKLAEKILAEGRL